VTLDATKICPDCAEEVKAAARVCRFCGYRFAELDARVPSAESDLERFATLSETAAPQPSRSNSPDAPTGEQVSEPEETGSPPNLALGATPGSLAGHFAEALEAAEARLKALMRMHKHAPRQMNALARALGRSCAMQEGAAQAELRKLRKQLAHPRRHPPPEWPKGTLAASAAAVAASATNHVATLLRLSADLELDLVDAPVSTSELIRLGGLRHMSPATNEQLAQVAGWLPRAKAALMQSSEQATALSERRRPFPFATRDDGDGTLFATVVQSLLAFTMRGNKWLTTTELALTRPELFVAASTNGEQERCFELSFLVLDGVLDLLENTVTELLFVCGPAGQ